MGTTVTHDASAPFSLVIETLRAPACPADSTAKAASLARCQLRDVQPFGLGPSISSNVPLATNWVTAASSSLAPAGPDLQPARTARRPQAARTMGRIGLVERSAWRFMIPPWLSVPPPGRRRTAGPRAAAGRAGSAEGTLPPAPGGVNAVRAR